MHKMADGPLPDSYHAEWAERIAAPLATPRPPTHSAVLFRLGEEWFALPTASCERVSPELRVRRLPNVERPGLLGIGSSGGELLVTVSLPVLLGVAGGAGAGGRTLILADGGGRYAAPVDEVFGVHRFHVDDLREPPAVLAGGCTSGLLSWEGRTVNFLEAASLFTALARAVS